MNNTKISETVTLTELPAFAKRFADTLVDGEVVILSGPLGAGKTTFVREVAHSLGSREIVASPTFSLIHEYTVTLHDAQTTLRHADLYRLDTAGEVYELGLLEMIASGGITLIEWGDTFTDVFTMPHRVVEIEITGAEERRFVIATNAGS